MEPEFASGDFIFGSLGGGRYFSGPSTSLWTMPCNLQRNLTWAFLPGGSEAWKCSGLSFAPIFAGESAAAKI